MPHFILVPFLTSGVNLSVESVISMLDLMDAVDEQSITFRPERSAFSFMIQ